MMQAMRGMRVKELRALTSCYTLGPTSTRWTRSKQEAWVWYIRAVVGGLASDWPAHFTLTCSAVVSRWGQGVY